MTTVTPTAAPTLRGVISGRVKALQNQYLKKTSASVAALARLRRGAGKQPGVVADIFEYTLDPAFVHDRRSDDTTRDEFAAHHCMTMFALHQQSQSNRMHKDGVRLGSAIRSLITADSRPDNPVNRRFAMLSTADSLEELVHHLRGFVQLLRSAQVPLDYGWLAEDLSHWQRGGDPRTRVVLAWGRSFHFVAATGAAAPTEPDHQ